MFGDPAITREIMGNVPAWLAMSFYALAALSCGWAGWSFAKRWRHYRESRATNTARLTLDWPTRLRHGIRYLVFHEQLRRDPYAGWAHLLMFYGFTILFIGTVLVFLEHDTPLHFFYGWFYEWASLVIDLGGLAFIVGLALFLRRRIVGKPKRILREWWVAALSVLLISIGISGFLLEGSRIAVDLPPHEKYSVVGYPIALAMRAVGISGEAAVRWQQWWWGGHAALCVGFFALLPWGFFSHIVYGLPSATARTSRQLSHIPVQPLNPAIAPGANAWWQLSPLDLLQSDACTTCGRCNEVCPAMSAGKPLEPRNVVLAIRDHQSKFAGDPSPIAVADDVLWSCTTCAACSHACPVEIDVYEKIVELRRGRVESGGAAERAVDVFESIDDRQNPYGRPAAERMRWAHGLNVPVAMSGEPIEVLYWVGCSGSFSPEGNTIARAMIKILNHLNVNYRVLGTAERCTGDPARRMGEEGLFQECAARNLHMLRSHGVQRVITHCPHCFNTLQNEYPALDENGVSGWTVQHHTQFLAEQVSAGRLNPAASAGRSVTFHDPCYLGRGNSVVAAPRTVLNGLNLPVIEMPRHGENSFCCGAGGGSMWLDVRGRERIENQRFEEAAATGAEVVGTGCPFCKTMLEAARAATESDGTGRRPPRVMDVAELVVAAEGL